MNQIQTDPKAVPLSTIHSTPAGHEPIGDTGTATEDGGETQTRSMFLQRPAKSGPNKPDVFPGKQRDRIRAEKRAERERLKAMSGKSPSLGVEEEEDGGADEDDGMEVDNEPVRDEREQTGEEREETMDTGVMDVDAHDPVDQITGEGPGQANSGEQSQVSQSIPEPAATGQVPSFSPAPQPSTSTGTGIDIDQTIQIPDRTSSAAPATMPIPPSPQTSMPASTLTPVSAFTPHLIHTATPTQAPEPTLHQPSLPLPNPDTVSDNADIFMSTPGAGPSTPTADVGLPSLALLQDPHSDMFMTGPRSNGRQNRGGRPRTRPLLEIHRYDQLIGVNVNQLPDNVRSKSPPSHLAYTSFSINRV